MVCVSVSIASERSEVGQPLLVVVVWLGRQTGGRHLDVPAPPPATRPTASSEPSVLPSPAASPLAPSWLTSPWLCVLLLVDFEERLLIKTLQSSQREQRTLQRQPTRHRQASETRQRDEETHVQARRRRTDARRDAGAPFSRLFLREFHCSTAASREDQLGKERKDERATKRSLWRGATDLLRALVLLSSLAGSPPAGPLRPIRRITPPPPPLRARFHPIAPLARLTTGSPSPTFLRRHAA